MSSVNIAEVAARRVDQGLPDDETDRAVRVLRFETVSFDTRSALLTACLRKDTRRLGLSPGDRACLALAKRLKSPVLTAGRAWDDVDVGVDVRLIRT